MKIGIVGAGKIGGALAATLVPLGHEVQISNSRGPETLGDVVADTGATAVTAREAVQDKDLVVVTIEQWRVPELARDEIFAGVPSSTIVVETNNYYPRQRDGRIDAIEDTEGLTESGWVSQQLGVPVIKAFNNIYFKHLREKGVPAGTDGRIALPIAGHDSAGKATVLELVDALGFDPVDAGTIDESWRQQPGTPVYGKDFDAAGVRAALAAARPGRPEEFTADAESPTH
jgi:8-hydroxy-5-deazaflavin:NADPH oxidoreductase